jgi:hypothetical protein
VTDTGGAGQTLQVSWRGGVWWIINKCGADPVEPSPEALDAWLATHDATRQDLAFGGSGALRQKFVHDFGPVDDAESRRT